jgi:putrescine transport system permease protein
MSDSKPVVTKAYHQPLGDKLWRHFVIGVPYFWLLLFFLAPFSIVLKISFATPIVAQPPFTQLFDFTGNASQWLLATWDNYQFLTEDNLYWVSYFKSIKIAAVSTFICLLVGYPMAYGIARAPMQMLYTDMAVYLGIVYTYIPFMILPLYATLEKMDTSLHDAAADLGAKPWQTFIDVTLPLSMPGIIAGSLLVFIPAIGEYVIPALLGGIDSLMIGRTLYDEFFVNRDWPLASAVATILLIIVVIPIMLFQRSQQEQE